jgi:predicted nucleic acid-binding protein
MKVIVDTSVWSQVLRRNSKNNKILLIRKEISELINESRIIVLGVVVQELLSGIKNKSQFIELRDHFDSFEIEKPDREYFIKAADFFNLCRQKGIQGSHIDFYICAVAYINNWMIYTYDNDFQNYSKIIDIKLYKGRRE